jgi:hypothetical protein
VRAIRSCGALVAAGLLTACASTPGESGKPANAASAAEQEAFELGVEAYVYGYPLVTMDMTRRVMTNAKRPLAHHAPMGQFYNAPTYPDAAFRDVTAPNADTLYSTAWLDLEKEPYVLSLPDEADRYFLMPMLSGWTDVFAAPGKRTTGTAAQTYAITGPRWQGKLPAGVTELRSPTNLVWILGRTYCTGTPADYKAVHALQDRTSLVPLSAWGRRYVQPVGRFDPSIDMSTPVRDQVNALDAGAFFARLAQLMRENPPAEADAPIVAKLAKLGIVPGEDFDMLKLDPAVQRGLARVPRPALEKIMGQGKAAGTHVNGWDFTTQTGVYGTDYLQRAYIAAVGLGANRPQDAVYPTSDVDAEGKPYDGANRYVVHFANGALPPAEAFWSLTLYDAEYFFVDNPLDRYDLGSRSALTPNADGSVDLTIQNVSPGVAKEANWLPAPAGRFVLMLRLYWPAEPPKPSILDGSWKPPLVERVP